MTIKETVIPNRNRPSAEMSATHNDVLCTVTGNSYRHHVCLCSGAPPVYTVQTPVWTSRQDTRQFTVGIVSFQKASPLSWAWFPIKNLSSKAFCHLLGIRLIGQELQENSFPYSSSFLSAPAAGLLWGRFLSHFQEWFWLQVLS